MKGDVNLNSMNRDITLEGVINAADKAKLGKAVGIYTSDHQMTFKSS